LDVVVVVVVVGSSKCDFFGFGSGCIAPSRSRHKLLWKNFDARWHERGSKKISIIKQLFPGKPFSGRRTFSFDHFPDHKKEASLLKEESFERDSEP